MASTTILDPEDALILLREGEISEPYNGKRKISSSTNFIGLNGNVARAVWQGYRSYKDEFADEGLYSFLDFALLHIDDVDFEDAGGSEDDWEGCMDALGVAPKLMAAVMMPEFEDIRLTGSAKYWVKDSMRIPYKGVGGHSRDVEVKTEDKAGTERAWKGWRH